MKAEALTELESWRPAITYQGDFVVAKTETMPHVLHPDCYGAGGVFKTRAAALRAANKQNDLDGLPRVA